jgi:archaellum component FlaC
MIILMFATALILSAIAAWYAIAGLMAIFAAAAIPIAIMGGTLEAAKLVVASWLYHNWKEIPKLLKTYFCIALIVLMTLTSMGIFGYLSKAHSDQTVPTGEVVERLNYVEDKIQTQKEIINEARETINQLDMQISKYTELGSVSRGVSVREKQRKERNYLQTTIQEAQAEIQKLNEERIPIKSQIREIEAEVGPVKYIAALIYGDNPDTNLLEKAVRIVILMIVFVFDPLAVLMLVAANWSLKRRQNDKVSQKQVKSETTQNDNEVVKDNSPKVTETTHSYLNDPVSWIPSSKPMVAPKNIVEELYDKEYNDYLESTKNPKTNAEYDSHGRLVSVLNKPHKK